MVEQETPREAGYEIVEHTADWAVRVWALDLAGLLAVAASAMSNLLVRRTADVPRTEQMQISLDAYDSEGLLVEWLSELAYWAEQEALVFTDFALEDVTPNSLRAVVSGGRVPELQKHIKAVTYHDLAITPIGDGLQATIVFDV